MREDIRTRKTFTMLSNTKSLKIRTDKIEIPDINSITIQMFKPQDKKMLIDLFCNDEAVQSICEDILNTLSFNNNDLTSVDLLSHLNTNNEDMPAQIDEFGNVVRKTKSFSSVSYRPQRAIHKQQYGNMQIQNSNTFMKTADLPISQTQYIHEKTRPYTSGSTADGVVPVQEFKMGTFDRPKISRLNSAIGAEKKIKTNRK
jgi:hypothetical protein